MNMLRWEVLCVEIITINFKKNYCKRGEGEGWNLKTLRNMSGQNERVHGSDFVMVR